MNLKKRSIVILTAVIMFVWATSARASAVQGGSNPPASEQKQAEQITLTDAQKDELRQLYNKKSEIQKQIIQKYVEFGVISKEKADLKIKRMEEMQRRMEQDGFIPKHKGRHGEHKKTDAPRPGEEN